MPAQVLHEPHGTRERLHGRPERVLPYAAGVEVDIDGELGREVREEGEEVRRGLALGWLAAECRTGRRSSWGGRTLAHEASLDVPCHLLAILCKDAICAPGTHCLIGAETINGKGVLVTSV